VTGWPAGSEDSIGQAGEFLVWANLIAQSGGGLHVFLPMLDRGIDGLVHRLDDGAYLAVQVKAKSALHGQEAPIAIYENHLYTPDQFVIGVHVDGDHLGPYALVVEAAVFEQKAARLTDRGRVMLIADMPLAPIPGHRWSEDLVPLEALAKRLGAAAPVPAAIEEEGEPEVSDEDRVIGSWGEQEVCLRMAMLDGCNVFRPFPDSEIVEVAVRRLASGKTLGIQVKTLQLHEPSGYGHVLVNRSSFVGAASTVLVALAWVLPERRFHETCLVIPSVDIPAIASGDGRYYELHFRPDGSRERSRLDQYRVPLASLGTEVARLLG
jgi:hypothetical protein